MLEVLRDLALERSYGSNLHIASVGCSYGAELYSTLWFIRSARPDLKISACGVDISPAAIAKARAGVFLRGDKELEWISERMIHDLFEDEAGKLIVKPWLREGIRWFVGDAMDPELSKKLGTQDILQANNFIGVMPEKDAEKCLANLYCCVKPGAYLIIDGVDLDLRTRFAMNHNLAPVCEGLEAIHLADRSKLGWPWDRWGAEPIDKKRDSWQMRYAAVFRIPAS